ncbi:DgyrCDS14516 [Dimorphilus gyrociliatus]|uniref:DgyrCDS14516 n=1 Tax=Dimorphilus gyrociliatus TaxID=2664684 RepID=A0A7I8WDW2_9ANNE|nr:DgyrCDS14516 [Dimorphilus gyrociliatus]
MKQSALWLLVSLAFTAAIDFSTLPEISYRGKTLTSNDRLVYKYENDILNGINGVSKHYAGLKIRANLVIEMESDLGVRCQLQNVQLLGVKRMELPTPFDQPIRGEMTPLTNVDELIEQLELAFGAKFTEERIVSGQIYCHKQDTEWSRNVKRSIISTLQINVPQYKLKENQLVNFEERDVIGTCESTVVVSRVNPEDETELALTKIRNFNNCRNAEVAPIYQYSLSGVSMCNDLPEKSLECKYQVVPSNRVEYRLRKVGGNSKWEHMFTAVQQKTVYFLPLTQQTTTTMAIYGLQRFTLATIQSELNRETAVPELDGSTYKRYNIEFEVNEKQLLPEQIVKEVELSEREQEQLVRRIVSEINSLHQHIKVGSEDVKQQLEKTVGLIRKCTPQILTKIYKQLSEQEKQVIFTDLLPTCATPECVQVVLDAIKNERVPLIKAISYVKMIALNAQPNKRIIKYIMTLGQNVEKKSLKRPLILAVGTLTNRLLQVYQVAGKEDKIVGFVEEIQESLIRIVKNQMRDVELCKCALKALGNMKCQENKYYEILKLIQNTDVPRELRVEAVEALRKTVSVKRVEKVLLQIFLNTNEHVELRMYAVQRLIDQQCRLETLQVIVQHLQNEANLNLQSFTYSLLKAISEIETPSPVYYKFVEKLRLLMITNRLPTFSPKYSHTLKAWNLDLESKTGVYAYLQYTYSRVSQVVPTWLRLKTFTSTMGHYTRLLEVTMKIQGMNQYTEKFLGRNINMIPKLFSEDISLEKITQLFTDEEMRMPKQFFNFFTQNKHTYNSMDVEEETGLELNVRLFDYDLMFADFECLKEVVMDTVEKIMSTTVRGSPLEQVKQLAEKLHRGIQIQTTNIYASVNAMTLVPTPTGFGAAWNKTVAWINHLNGKIQVQARPSLKECIEEMRLPQKIVIKTGEKTFQQRTITFFRSKLVSMIPQLSQGVMYEGFVSTSLPVKGELQLVNGNNKDVWMIQGLYKPSTEYRPTVVSYIRPVAFVEYPEHEHLTPLLSKMTTEPYTIEKFIELPYVAKNLKVQIQSCIRKTPVSSLVPFACPNKVELVLEPVVPTPVRFSLEFRPLQAIQRPESEVYETLRKALFGEEEVKYALEDNESRISYIFGKGSEGRVVYKNSLRLRIIHDTTTDLSMAEPKTDCTFHWVFTPEFTQHQFALLMKQSVLPELYVKGHLIVPSLCLNRVCEGQEFAGLTTFLNRRRVSMIKLFVDDNEKINEQLGIRNERCFNKQTQSLKKILPQTIRMQIKTSPVVLQFVPEGLINTLVVAQQTLLQGLRKVSDVSLRYLPSLPITETEMYMKICPALGKVDVVANLMKHSIRIVNIPVFRFLAPQALPVPVNAQQQLIHQTFPAGLSRSVCVKTSKFVQTFENVEYHTNEETECESVLAKDCRRAPKWMITSKVLSNAHQQINAYFGNQQTLELIPSTWGELPEVRINGEVKEIEEFSTLRIPAKYNPTFITCTRDGRQIVCECETLGWKIVSDSYKVKVTVAPEIRNYVCGQCGNDDGVVDTKTLISHTIASSSRCRIERKPLRECQPIYKHKVKEQSYPRGPSKVCISVLAFPECSANCQVLKKFSKGKLQPVKYYCMDKEYAVKKGYLPEYFEGESIESVGDLEMDNSFEVMTEKLLDVVDTCKVREW